MTTADEKTLKLATLQLTTVHLQGLRRYVEHMLGALQRESLQSAQLAAQAHQLALLASGLDAVELQKVRSQVSAFCSGVAVEERVAAAKSEKTFDWRPFRTRYGEAAFVLLQKERATLVPLVRRLERYERGGI